MMLTGYGVFCLFVSIIHLVNIIIALYSGNITAALGWGAAFIYSIPLIFKEIR